jgi:hypothetical protein
MGRPKVVRLRWNPDHSPAARGAIGPRPGCEIVEWWMGLVARRIERRPVLAVLAADESRETVVCGGDAAVSFSLMAGCALPRSPFDLNGLRYGLILPSDRPRDALRS